MLRVRQRKVPGNVYLQWQLGVWKQWRQHKSWLWDGASSLLACNRDPELGTLSLISQPPPSPAHTSSILQPKTYLGAEVMLSSWISKSNKPNPRSQWPVWSQELNAGNSGWNGVVLDCVGLSLLNCHVQIWARKSGPIRQVGVPVV